jgi:hypothetical protein
MDEKVFVNTEVSKDLDRQARLAAAVLGVSRSEVVRRGLIAYLAGLDLPGVVSRKTAEVSRDRQPA